MILSKIKGDMALIIGLGIMVFSLGGLLYVYGQHHVLKEQHAELTEQRDSLLTKVAELETQKSEIEQANATNEATIKQLREDINKSQIIINQAATRTRTLQSTITRLQIEAAKGTDQDGQISPVLADTLKSLPGATK